MAKVLISFLGVALEGYRQANYKFSDGKVITSTFIAEALKEYFEIDKLILIGTSHSMWDEIYNVLGREDIENRKDKLERIKEVCKGSNHDLSLMTNKDIRTIEEGLGEQTKVIIIKYGLNDEEIAYNTKQIFQIESFLEQDDVLYLDITHSFRSLPIYLMNCLIYLKNVCAKNLTIESISYGMLDVSSEYPTGNKIVVGGREIDELWTPVVELKKILDVQDWIIGAYNFKEFGNTYKIASLLEKETSGNYSAVAREIREFADIKNLNYLNMYMNATSRLDILTQDSNLPEIGRMVIVPAMKEFISLFPQNMKLSKFQFRMAKWHNERHNYGFALMLLVESIVSFCCEICKWDPNNRSLREDAKKAMKDEFKAFSSAERRKIVYHFHLQKGRMELFCKEYDFIKEIRNMIVHNNLGLNMTSSQIVECINDEIIFFEKYINPSKRKNPRNPKPVQTI